MRPPADPGPTPRSGYRHRMDRDPPLVRLLPLVLREWRHHPWRHALVALAVSLGVALAFSVQVINDSALAEFAITGIGSNKSILARLPPERLYGFSDLAKPTPP